MRAPTPGMRRFAVLTTGVVLHALCARGELRITHELAREIEDTVDEFVAELAVEAGIVAVARIARHSRLAHVAVVASGAVVTGHGIVLAHSVAELCERFGIGDSSAEDVRCWNRQTLLEGNILP